MKNIKKLNSNLFVAATCGESEEIEILIKKGANVNSRDEDKNTPLHWASLYGYIDSMSVLILNGANISLLDDMGRSPLHDAAHGANPQSVIKLISNGANINCKDFNGNTPLHDAAKHIDAETAITLLVNGASVTLKNKRNKTPLDIACINLEESSSVPLALIAYGSKISKSTDIFEEIRDFTMRQAAAQGGFTERMIELLNDHPSSLPQDAPEDLAILAKRHEKHDTAAAIQSFIASQAIESMMNGSSQAKSPSKF